jgi:hypothetical protein
MRPAQFRTGAVVGGERRPPPSREAKGVIRIGLNRIWAAFTIAASLPSTCFSIREKPNLRVAEGLKVCSRQFSPRNLFEAPNLVDKTMLSNNFLKIGGVAPCRLPFFANAVWKSTMPLIPIAIRGSCAAPIFPIQAEVKKFVERGPRDDLVSPKSRAIRGDNVLIPRRRSLRRASSVLQSLTLGKDAGNLGHVHCAPGAARYDSFGQLLPCGVRLWSTRGLISL